MSHHESSRLTRADLLLRATVGVVGLVGLGRTLPGRSAAAAGSRGPSPSMVIHDEPIERGRRLAGRRTARFNLLGLHWRGSGDVWFRCGDGLAWTPWQRAVVHELADGEGGRDPRVATRHAGLDGWLHRARVPPRRRRQGVAGARDLEPGGRGRPSPRLAPAPFVVPRSFWYADESIVRAAPLYADRIRFAVIHHTAGRARRRRRSQRPSCVRSRSTTSAPTAGTTSATTSSSTRSGRSSRDDEAEPIDPSSARTSAGSTSARSALPCSETTSASPSPRRPARPCCEPSPGASTSPTWILWPS